jgi:hypothetical protein
VWVDVAKFFPPLPNHTWFNFIIGVIAEPLFAVTFIFYRIIMWWQVSYQMWMDIRHVLNNGMAEKLRPGRNHVLYVMLVSNALLGCLQLYWCTIILEEAQKVLLGGKS